jgi:hypothetical protein
MPVKRALVLSVLGVLALTAGAIWLVHRITEPEPWPGPAAVRAAEGPATASGPDRATAPEAAGAPEPNRPRDPPPGVIMETGPTPPPLPAAPEARAEALMELRSQRRSSAFEGQAAREAARRERLGLPPAAGTNSLAPRPPRPGAARPSSPDSNGL